MTSNEFTCPHCGYTWTPRTYPPNFCAKCNKALSKEAKRKKYEQALRCAVKKASRILELWSEKQRRCFSELATDSATSTKELCRQFNISLFNYYQLKKILDLPKRSKGGGWAISKKSLGAENEQRILKYLQSVGGTCELKKLNEAFPPTAIQRLLYKRRIFKVQFDLGRQPGGYKRNILHLLFKEEYAPNFRKGRGIKSFVCLSRTAVVRLMCKALIKPENQHIQKILTSFLRRYLSKAEQIAVLWNLGVRSFSDSQIKRNMKIDGILGPIRRYREYPANLRRLLSNLDEMEIS